MNFDLARIRPIKLVIFDVDGVLTDGRIVIDDQGFETKFFNVRDGHGIKLLMKAGLETALITGRRSRVVEHRAAELGISAVHQGIGDKLSVYEKLLSEKNLEDRQAAYAGDDLVDLAVMRRVGLAMAPADACPEALEAAHFISRFPGGRGSVREMAELILKGRGLWEKILDEYR